VLIPDSRGDIMHLLISLDKIPHLFEKVLFMVKYQGIVIPREQVMDIQDLVRISLESCEILARQVTLFLKNQSGIRSLLTTIDNNESHCDRIERRIIKKIFDSEIDNFLKLQLKELVLTMGDISDQTERVAKRVNILSLKRRV